MATEPILQWESYSRELPFRTDDWFWALGAFAFFGAIISLILGNLLLALIIGLAGFIIYQHERRPVDPHLDVKIDQRGVQLNNELFTYEKIRSFWIEEATPDKPAKLVLHYQRIFVPNIHIPIVGPTPEEVRRLMLKNGEEEKHTETFTEVLYETLGF